MIPEVPDAPEGFERIGHEITHVNAETNVPLWDGSSLDYGAAVSGLMDDRRVAWVDPDGEEDPSTRADPHD
ncbi:MAG TPA: hypothetical protein VFF73_33985 [Planctomycetota bacterium]|nr:hypothetical protein [Planctomycetota bacterium]